MDPMRFIHSRWTMFEEMAGLVPRERDPLREGMNFRRVSDLTITLQVLAGKPTALIQMPMPEQPVEAFFVGVALLANDSRPESWSRDVQARVLTLEAEIREHPQAGKTGVVCEWTKAGLHRNLGFGVPAQRDAFMRTMAAVLQAPEAPSAGGFSPPKGGAPGAIIIGEVDVPRQTTPCPARGQEKPWWKIW